MLFLDLTRVVYQPILIHWLFLEDVCCLDSAQSNHAVRNRHLFMLKNEIFNYETPKIKTAFKSFLVWATSKKIKLRSFSLKKSGIRFKPSSEILAIYEGIEVLNVHWGALAEQLIALGGERLRQLTISSGKVPVEALLNLISEHQGLEVLHIMSPVEFSGLTYVFDLDHLPRNDRLATFTCHSQHIDDGLFSTLLQLCPNMNDLSLKNCKLLTDEALLLFANSPLNLAVLEMKNCLKVRDSAIASILSHCKGPVSVTLNDDRLLSQVVTSALLKNPCFASLQRLSIRLNYDLSARFITSLVVHCPLLKHLDITQTHNKLFAFARDIVHLKHLEWLHIGPYTCDYRAKHLSIHHENRWNYIFCIGEGKFIDASKLLSCFARYYNCAVNRSDQNVCVERLLWTNPQKAICFITTKDVQKGEEFLISYGCEYWERQSSKAIMSDAFRRVCNRLMNKVSYEYQPQEELYSFQAPDMAREFRDDRSDSDDGDDSSDSDYVDSSRRTYSSRVADQSNV